jgi:hypothetical protein
MIIQDPRSHHNCQRCTGGGACDAQSAAPDGGRACGLARNEAADRRPPDFVHAQGKSDRNRKRDGQSCDRALARIRCAQADLPKLVPESRKRAPHAGGLIFHPLAGRRARSDGECGACHPGIPAEEPGCGLCHSDR